MASMESLRSKLEVLAIEEENWAKKYSDLMLGTNLSNIRMFLEAFAKSRDQFSNDINNFLNKKYVINNENKTLRKLYDIQATRHLLNAEDIDPNSLQSILLYISKAETDTYARYEAILVDMEDSSMKKMFSNIVERRERVMLKADNIYHDMIETSV
jgi:rubrerythrin